MTEPPAAHLASLNDDIVAFDEMRPSLEADHLGKWVVFYNRELVGIFESFDSAARDAVSRFGRGPYLIRQIGASSVTLPASVMYGTFHAVNSVRS